MANRFTYQVLRDTTTDSVIKLTGVFDGASGQEANNSRISANSLAFALDANNNLLVSGNTAKSYYDVQLTGVKYFVNMPTSNTGSGLGTVEIFWNGNGATAAAQYANSATIFHLNSQGDFGNGEQLPSILNNSGNTAQGNTGWAGSGVNPTVGNGDIGVYTSGAAANCSYTLIITLRKNNAMFERGQFADPAAFNFGNYSLKP